MLARRAQRTADIAVTEERRRVFELGILRELLPEIKKKKLVRTKFPQEVLTPFNSHFELMSNPPRIWSELHLSLYPGDFADFASEKFGSEYRTKVERLSAFVKTQPPYGDTAETQEARREWDSKRDPLIEEVEEVERRIVHWTQYQLVREVQQAISDRVDVARDVRRQRISKTR